MTRPNQKKGFPGGDAPSIYSIFGKLGQVNNEKRNLPTAPDALASAQTPEALSGTVPTDFSLKDKNQSVNGNKKRFQLKEPVEDY